MNGEFLHQLQRGVDAIREAGLSPWDFQIARGIDGVTGAVCMSVNRIGQPSRHYTLHDDAWTGRFVTDLFGGHFSVVL
jgi:hypothetical protein